jgi:hypothetical protein
MSPSLGNASLSSREVFFSRVVGFVKCSIEPKHCHATLLCEYHCISPHFVEQ